MTEYSFSDLVDTASLQQLMDCFYKATAIPIGIIDLKNNVLVATGWQRICTEFHRVHPATCRRCHESDHYIEQQLDSAKGYIKYKCKNGMWDIAVPIRIDGKHLATLFVGQFFYEDEKLDRDYFTKQAETFGFDKLEYLAALEQVRTFSRSEIKRIMDFYIRFTEMIASLGHMNYLLSQRVDVLENLLPICANCKKIRNDEGSWERIEHFMNKHSDMQFSHDICPDCRSTLYPGFTPAN